MAALIAPSILSADFANLERDLNAISTATFTALGRVYRGHMVALRVTNAKLTARALRMVQELTGLDAGTSRELLQQAGGIPRLALAMHLTGLSANAASELLEERGLRSLESFLRK